MSSINTEYHSRPENDELYEDWERARCTDLLFSEPYVNYLTSIQLAGYAPDDKSLSLSGIVKLHRSFKKSKIVIPLQIVPDPSATESQANICSDMRRVFDTFQVIQVAQYAAAIRNPQYSFLSTHFYTALPGFIADQNTVVIRHISETEDKRLRYIPIIYDMESLLNDPELLGHHISISANIQSGVYYAEITPGFNSPQYTFSKRGPRQVASFIGYVNAKRNIHIERLPHICQITPYPLDTLLNGLKQQSDFERMILKR